VTFTDPFAASNVGTPLHVALHPTQLYDAAAELLILIFLLATERRGRPFPGRTFWFYILFYGVSRFAIEFYRGDPRGMVWGLPTSQIISLVLVPAALVMLAVLRRTAAATDDGAAPAGPKKRGRR
jgi:phosphatidylglycerol---prolipoprotein diacylglyceryl transferase